MNHIIAFACTACLISGCAHANGRAYLAASEIERLVVGKALKDASADEWKESFLPGDTDARQGRIWGRSRVEPPYTGRWSMDGDRICVEYPGDEGGCYRLSLEEGNRVLWFDGAGALAFESTLVEADRPEALGLPFSKETMAFRHGENTLVGDLRLPTGPGPHPAIVFVHGSGPSSRHDGWGPIGDEFLRRGFAILIWSKPGVDESTGDWREQSMDDRAREVEAAIRYLATRSEIDPDRIGLFGGSQAGWVVPKVAARQEVAFMILVSCPAQSGMSQMLYAAESALALLEIPEGERPPILDHVGSYYELVRASESHEQFLRGQESLLGEAKERSWYAELQRPPTAPEAWFLASLASDPLWFFRFGPIDRTYFHFLHGLFVDDAPPRLEDLRSPLLAIYGTKDILVDWKLGSRVYERVPEIAGNPDVTVVLFEGADHVLVQPDREGYLDFAPGYLTTMGEWLSKRR